MVVFMNRTPIFDTVRAMLGRGFTQAEVDELDDAIDLAMGIIVVRPSGAKRTVSDAGIRLIQGHEKCAVDRGDGYFKSYPDPGSANGLPWTIGWGHTGEDVGSRTVWSKAKCDEVFEEDLKKFSEEVADFIGETPTTQSQFDALVSFHYNTGAIKTSTLGAMHKAGNYSGARNQFKRWIYNDGKKMRGLIKRRREEAALYGGESAR